MKRYCATLGAVLFVLQAMTPTVAHTTVKDTVPKNGAVLEQSPPFVEIRFEHAASLTSAVLIGAGKAERQLVFTPVGSAMTFRLTNPNLGPGRNEIFWKALSGDGHVISGSLVFVIKSAADKTG